MDEGDHDPQEQRGAGGIGGGQSPVAKERLAKGPLPKERIAKAMARAGLCSRRDAEAFIAAGRVAVNGATITSPAATVTAHDRIMVDGKPLPRRQRTRLFLYHKPAGIVSTHADPQGRPTLFDSLPAGLPRLVSIGRLDIGTEGLLLLTNDGSLARVLELPRTEWVRRYRVRAHGRVSQPDLDRLRGGVTIDGIHYGPIEATLEREQGSNAWLAFAIREGKNREVRNVLAHLGLQVSRLIRIAFGPFRLGELAPGAIEEVPTAVLRRELGESIIALAGCDFTSPAIERPAAPARQRPAREWPARERCEGRKPLDTHDRGERAEKPRPRRGHAWRKDDAPLRRHYRGSRREELKIKREEREDKRAGLIADRKGRRILVERFGAKKILEPAEPPERARPPRHPPRDRASGPRPSRPPAPRSEALHPDSPRSNPPRATRPRSKSAQPSPSWPNSTRQKSARSKWAGLKSGRPKSGATKSAHPNPPRLKTPRSKSPSRLRKPGNPGRRPPRED